MALLPYLVFWLGPTKDDMKTRLFGLSFRPNLTKLDRTTLLLDQVLGQSPPKMMRQQGCPVYLLGQSPLKQPYNKTIRFFLLG
jgi:hypothetical protein